MKFRDVGRELIKFEVGNDQRIVLWHVFWHPKGLLLTVYKPRIVYDAALHINTKRCKVIQGDSWLWPAARSNNLVEILLDIQPRSDKDDLATWSPSKSGIYYTGATWNWFRAHSPIVPWHGLV